MKKFQVVFALAMLLMAIAGMTQSTSAAPVRQSGPATWTVLVGAQGEMQQTEHGPAGAWQFVRFYPDSITINVGDTIVFKENSLDVHNVYFLVGQPPNLNPFIVQGKQVLGNPAVFSSQGGSTFDGSATASSGALGLPLANARTEYKLTFTKVGTYNYGCIFHTDLDPKTGQISGMVGKVIVQAAGSAYPQTQAQIDAVAQGMIATDIKAALATEPQVKQVTDRPGPNGTTIHAVNVGGMSMTVLGEYMRFSPDNLTIKVGDTVEWTFNGGPHNVLFTSGGPDVELVPKDTQPDQQLVFNPQAVFPSGGNTYNGSGLVGSGVPQGDPNSAPQTYSLTFTKPGTYEYLCSFHDHMGMVGHVTVLAAQGSGSTMPLMPQTGSSVLDNLATWGLIAASFILVAALMLLVLRLQRGRKQAN